MLVNATHMPYAHAFDITTTRFDMCMQHANPCSRPTVHCAAYMQSAHACTCHTHPTCTHMHHDKQCSTTMQFACMYIPRTPSMQTHVALHMHAVYACLQHRGCIATHATCACMQHGDTMCHNMQHAITCSSVTHAMHTCM